MNKIGPLTFAKPLPVFNLLVGGIVLVGLIVALTAYETFTRRERAYQDMEANLGLLVTALAEHTERTVQSIDVLVHNIDADLARVDLASPAGVEAASRMLQQRIADFPNLLSINILGKEGELVASSFANPATYYGDRDYFVAARQGLHGRRINISKPLLGRGSKRWAISVTLRRENKQGEFLGVIYAGIDLEKLNNYFRNVIPFEGAAVALYRRDARLLARYPLVPEAFDKDYSGIAFFRTHLPESPNGFYRAVSSIDSVPRSVAYRSIPAYGLVINVSANEQFVEMAWRKNLWLPAIVGSLGLAVIFALVVMTLRHRQNQRELQERIAWQANHDAATGLPNRFLFEDRLRKALQAAERTGRSLVLLFIDLDNFKRINDSLGHAMGDEVLRTTAAWLKASVRESDTVARFGGDEFAVLLPEIRQEDDAGAIAAKILQQFNQAMRFGGKEITVTTSIGIATYPQDGGDPIQLMASADAAMYRAKESGRNLACLFDRELSDRVQERMRLEEALHSALDRQELHLVFQPLVESGDGAVVGAEVLLRWQHPELGNIPPDRFILIAESTGLIEPIGNWVLGEACRRAAAWPEPGGKPLRIAVNISPRQLKRPHFAAEVRGILAATGLPAARLEIEITESLLVSPDSQATENLSQLRELGIGLAIDDFGTGYSSLSYLSRLPVTMLKIDRSFVARLDNSPQDRVLARAIAALAHGLGLKTVGEGVETEAQSTFLRDIRCHYQQGYLHARPLPGDQFLAWLQTRGQDG